MSTVRQGPQVDYNLLIAVTLELAWIPMCDQWTYLGSRRSEKAITSAAGQSPYLPGLTDAHGMLHSLYGIPRDAEARVNSRTESLTIPHTPPAVVR